MQRLRFGTKKCVKLHVGKTCNENLCKDLFMDGWKLEVKEDAETGKCCQVETFVGKEKMGLKKEQLYLGDVISDDWKDDKNVQARITQIIYSSI